MGLFSKLKLGKKKQHCFVFICRGPDPSGMTKAMRSMHMTDRGLYEAMVQYGFQGKAEDLHMYGPDWNRTQYSSWKPTPTEGDDLLAKIKKALQKEGFTYNGENVKTARYDPSTTYGQMGLFMTYLFIEK